MSLLLFSAENSPTWCFLSLGFLTLWIQCGASDKKKQLAVIYTSPSFYTTAWMNQECTLYSPSDFLCKHHNSSIRLWPYLMAPVSIKGNKLPEELISLIHLNDHGTYWQVAYNKIYYVQYCYSFIHRMIITVLITTTRHQGLFYLHGSRCVFGQFRKLFYTNCNMCVLCLDQRCSYFNNYYCGKLEHMGC